MEPLDLIRRNTPACLRGLRQWVCWRYESEPGGRYRKVPCDPKTGRPASSTDPATWSTFEEALEACAAGKDYAGVGFVFTQGDPYCGIDLDDCIDDGNTLAGWAAEIVADLASYAEVSPSGRGVKVFVRAVKPGERCRAACEGGEIEMYDRGRFFTVTGNTLKNVSQDVEERQAQVDALYARVFGAAGGGTQAKPSAAGPCALSDDQIIRLAGSLRRKNGAGRKFADLFEGRWDGYFGSASEADSSLCWTLAYYTKDAGQIDRIFRRSGLYRPKWDQRHGRATYGELTIEKALAGVSEQYEPKKGLPAAKATAGEDGGPLPPLYRPDEVARLFLESNDRMLYWRGVFHLYGGTCYQPLAEAELGARIAAFITEVGWWTRPARKEGVAYEDGAVPHPDYDDLMVVLEKIIPRTAHIREIILQLKIDYLPDSTDAPVWLSSFTRPPAEELFACANGLLHLPTGTMHPHDEEFFSLNAVAAKSITEDVVKARLLDEIGRAKKLTEGASGAGVKVHTLPTRPRDIEDDGAFHYAVLGPAAASESGKPSAEACRYLDETTGPEKPRVFRNAVLLLVPAREGLDVAATRVQDYLAWEQVKDELNRQQQDGNVDVARMQTLAVHMDKAKGRIPDSIRQAYCIVVTVNEANEDHAFKITVSDDPHFATIKADKRSRIQDTAITAEALLPGGPYNLWHEGETTRRVKDLAGAFAQLPHLPKMLKAQAILDTLVDGCERGSFVLKLTRPDHTFRTWWKSRPDENALADPALELVLPEAAELGEVSPLLLAPKALPGLWTDDEVTVGAVVAYFNGTKVVQVKRENYEEPMQIPKAPPAVVHKAIEEAVLAGLVWMTSGPTSVIGEPVPAGTLTDAAVLRVPPKPIPAPDILPENLPDAWKDGAATALSIATALSQKVGHTLPWKVVRDVIHAALQARFLELMPDSGTWPCDFPAAQTIKIKVAAGGRGGGGGGRDERPKVRIAAADLEVAEFQDLTDALPKLLEVKAKTNVPIAFRVEVSVGDGKTDPPAEAVESVNKLLAKIKDGFRLA